VGKITSNDLIVTFFEGTVTTNEIIDTLLGGQVTSNEIIVFFGLVGNEQRNNNYFLRIF
jgi:hypothetical protein